MIQLPPSESDDPAETAVARLIARLRKARTPREAAWAVSTEAITAIGLEDCVVYLLDNSGTLLTQMAAYGPKLRAPQVIANPLTLRLGQGVVGHCAAARIPIRIDDTRSDPRYLVDDAARLSELALPLIHDGELLGVLDSEHSRAGFYQGHHERVMLQMAALLSAHLALLRLSVPQG
ncbi:MAG: GAF domain-containing protein [Xanthomonadales bacterium]|nr:GAF domain-containing protein [Xanthomonadales bacterium]MCC6561655.1 GAF domain-containing protein [Xanthomonadales bacterium]